jgi:hypothetical protein
VLNFFPENWEKDIKFAYPALTFTNLQSDYFEKVRDRRYKNNIYRKKTKYETSEVVNRATPKKGSNCMYYRELDVGWGRCPRGRAPA